MLSKLLRHTYRYTYTSAGILVILGRGLALLVAGIVIIVLEPALGVWLTLAAGATYCVLVFRPGHVSRASLAHRAHYLAQLNTAATPQPPTVTPLIASLPYADWVPMHVTQGIGWRYADYRYTVKYNVIHEWDVDGAWRLFSTIEIDLPRKLPALMFDSKSGGHAFGWRIDQSQRTSLEGNFDDFFTTYFPLRYHIDARSVISPEVMVAMLELKDCDIEIQDDQLYVYCPMVPEAELQAFITKAIEIERKLADHIVHYRDERLPGTTDRQNVAVIGSRLNRSPVRPILLGVGFAVAAVVVAVRSYPYMGAVDDAVYSILGIIIAIAASIMCFADAMSIRREAKMREITHTVSPPIKGWRPPHGLDK